MELQSCNEEGSRAERRSLLRLLGKTLAELYC
jgi:hypothetical protein